MVGAAYLQLASTGSGAGGGEEEEVATETASESVDDRRSWLRKRAWTVEGQTRRRELGLWRWVDEAFRNGEFILKWHQGCGRRRAAPIRQPDSLHRFEASRSLARPPCVVVCQGQGSIPPPLSLPHSTSVLRPSALQADKLVHTVLGT